MAEKTASPKYGLDYHKSLIKRMPITGETSVIRYDILRDTQTSIKEKLHLLDFLIFRSISMINTGLSLDYWSNKEKWDQNIDDFDKSADRLWLNFNSCIKK